LKIASAGLRAGRTLYLSSRRVFKYPAFPRDGDDDDEDESDGDGDGSTRRPRKFLASEIPRGVP